MDGQRKIREMWKHQVEQQRKAERERLRAEKENTEIRSEALHLDNISRYNEEDQFEQQIIIKSIYFIFQLTSILIKIIYHIII